MKVSIHKLENPSKKSGDRYVFSAKYCCMNMFNALQKNDGVIMLPLLYSDFDVETSLNMTLSGTPISFCPFCGSEISFVRK